MDTRYIIFTCLLLAITTSSCYGRYARRHKNVEDSFFDAKFNRRDSLQLTPTKERPCYAYPGFGHQIFTAENFGDLAETRDFYNTNPQYGVTISDDLVNDVLYCSCDRSSNSEHFNCVNGKDQKCPDGSNGSSLITYAQDSLICPVPQ